jgi:hypothetical protein
MVFRGYFQHYNFHTLNDIPNTVLVPPETQYSLASVILTDGGHFIGISLDIRNSPGIHLIFDGIKHKHEERIQIISLEDPLSKIAPSYEVMELWYVKVDSGSSTAGTEISSLIIPPRHRQMKWTFIVLLSKNSSLSVTLARVHYKQKTSLLI